MRRFAVGAIVTLCLPVAALAQLLPTLGPWGAAAAAVAATAPTDQRPQVINPKSVVAPVNTPQMPKKSLTMASLWPFGKKKGASLTHVAPSLPPSKSGNPFADMAPMPGK